MAQEDERIKKLKKYIPLKETQVGASFPTRSTKSVSAMDAADLAEGIDPGTTNKDLANALAYSKDMGWSKEGQEAKEAAVSRKLDKVSELADQYKRETRGKKSGGSIRSASSRADGIAARGKTRGKMY
jgi:hypothetical protein